MLDLQVTDEALYVADHSSKSVVVSSIETNVLNYEQGIMITAQVDNYSLVSPNAPWESEVQRPISKPKKN